jgi:hypothetical protein
MNIEPVEKLGDDKTSNVTTNVPDARIYDLPSNDVRNLGSASKENVNRGKFCN